MQRPGAASLLLLPCSHSSLTLVTIWSSAGFRYSRTWQARDAEQVGKRLGIASRMHARMRAHLARAHLGLPCSPGTAPRKGDNPTPQPLAPSAQPHPALKLTPGPPPARWRRSPG